MSTDVDVLARVGRFREAARIAVRADAPFKEICLVLLDLADMARKEPDLTVRTWAERAVWEESRAFLGMDDDAPAVPPVSYEEKVRALRREGLIRCDRCGHDLPTEEQLERWARMRKDHAETLAARERAV